MRVLVETVQRSTLHVILAFDVVEQERDVAFSAAKIQPVAGRDRTDDDPRERSLVLGDRHCFPPYFGKKIAGPHGGQPDKEVDRKDTGQAEAIDLIRRLLLKHFYLIISSNFRYMN